MKKINSMKVEYFALKIYKHFKGSEVAQTAICLFVLETIKEDSDLFFKANKKEVHAYIQYLIDNGYIYTVYDNNNVFVFKFRKRRNAVKNKKKSKKNK